MKYKFIHISDLHYRINFEEDQELVLAEFFSDVATQIDSTSDRSYLIFSGDMVLAGSDDNLYELLTNEFDERLNSLGIDKSKRILVPGNHDASKDVVQQFKSDHDDLTQKEYSENEFNSYIASDPPLISKKFESYIKFHNYFSGFKITPSEISGKGFNLSDEMGIYSLNSALLTDPGAKKDYQNLIVETRNLHKWCLQNTCKYKILILHHPISWLRPDWERELKKIINKHFDMVFYGHAHDQDWVKNVRASSTDIFCSAPALLTNKHGKLGYSITEFCPEIGPLKTIYRQWNDNYKFVPGVNFTNNQTGEVLIRDAESSAPDDFVLNLLQFELSKSLKIYSRLPEIWLEPTLKKVSEIQAKNLPKEPPPIEKTDLLNSRAHYCIKAPPQFGLTCLGKELCLSAWKQNREYWFYFDMTNVKAHVFFRELEKQLELLHISAEELGCFVLDRWNPKQNNQTKLVNKALREYPNVRFFLLRSENDKNFDKLEKEEDEPETLAIKLETIYLWSLEKSQIRNIVSSYNEKFPISQDDNAVLKRVSKDFEKLNFYRTPFNCITLLKALESNFNENPVNRAEVLHKILVLIFDTYDPPTHKTNPDLLDCEFVLGYFCEELIKERSNSFSKAKLLSETAKFCEKQLIALNVHTLLNILLANNIVVFNGVELSFRYTHWIFYFAAKRMHHNDDFRDFVLSAKKYTDFPEIIDFYTGINRDRNDALRKISEDLKETVDLLNEKLDLPEGFNTYSLLEWNTSPQLFENMERELDENVKNSDISNELKDRFSDQSYDRAKPYNQKFAYINEKLMPVFFQIVSACSRALRNSDYADPIVKKDVLGVITESMETMAKAYFVLLPELVENHRAAYEGQHFYLVGHEQYTDKAKLFVAIYKSIPLNVSQHYEDDIYNVKMGPLLYEELKVESNHVKLQQLMWIIIKNKPLGWHEIVVNFIKSADKNSFLLMDVFLLLRSEYMYSYSTDAEIKQIAYLLKAIALKHNKGIKSPSKKAISKVDDDILPERK